MPFYLVSKPNMEIRRILILKLLCLPFHPNLKHQEIFDLIFDVLSPKNIKKISSVMTSIQSLKTTGILSLSNISQKRPFKKPHSNPKRQSRKMNLRIIASLAVILLVSGAKGYNIQREIITTAEMDDFLQRIFDNAVEVNVCPRSTFHLLPEEFGM